MPHYRSVDVQPTPETRVRQAITALCAASARRRAAQPGSPEHRHALQEELEAARCLEWAARALPADTDDPREGRPRVTPAA